MPLLSTPAPGTDEAYKQFILTKLIPCLSGFLMTEEQANRLHLDQVEEDAISLGCWHEEDEGFPEHLCAFVKLEQSVGVEALLEELEGAHAHIGGITGLVPEGWGTVQIGVEALEIWDEPGVPQLPIYLIFSKNEEEPTVEAVPTSRMRSPEVEDEYREGILQRVLPLAMSELTTSEQRERLALDRAGATEMTFGCAPDEEGNDEEHLCVYLAVTPPEGVLDLFDNLNGTYAHLNDLAGFLPNGHTHVTVQFDDALGKDSNGSDAILIRFAFDTWPDISTGTGSSSATAPFDGWEQYGKFVMESGFFEMMEAFIVTEHQLSSLGVDTLTQDDFTYQRFAPLTEDFEPVEDDYSGPVHFVVVSFDIDMGSEAALDAFLDASNYTHTRLKLDGSGPGEWQYLDMSIYGASYSYAATYGPQTLRFTFTFNNHVFLEPGSDEEMALKKVIKENVIPVVIEDYIDPLAPESGSDEYRDSNNLADVLGLNGIAAKDIDVSLEFGKDPEDGHLVAYADFLPTKSIAWARERSFGKDFYFGTFLRGNVLHGFDYAKARILDQITRTPGGDLLTLRIQLWPHDLAPEQDGE